MRKVNHWKFIRHQRRRERSRLLRLNKNTFFRFEDRPIYKDVSAKLRHDNIIASKFNFPLDAFLNENGNPINTYSTRNISIPNIFSLENNYSESIYTLSSIRKTLMEFSDEEVSLDFSRCNNVDFSILFLLKVLLEEYLNALRKLKEKLIIKRVLPTIRIKKSKDDGVNKKLIANQIIDKAKITDQEFIPVSTTSLITGSKSQKLYDENKKGLAVTKIRSLINQGLSSHQYCLSDIGINHLDGLVSEILNNAEDHSLFNTWYAYGNLFESKKKDDSTDIVGEINLAVLNFGYSINDGFEGTKENNHEVYSDMEKLYQELISQHGNKFSFNKEQMFTLFALQDGFSRLKYIEESRGTGTIKFIRSFLNLGDYEDKTRGFVPHLHIYSGNTLIKCDNLYKPFAIDNVYYLSLNSENDLRKPPEKSHLCVLPNRFPGTFLVVKIYLNHKHLKQKFNPNGN